jgi:hypothetical protein
VPGGDDAGAPSAAKSSAASAVLRVRVQSPVPSAPLLSRYAYTRYVSPAAKLYPQLAELPLVVIVTASLAETPFHARVTVNGIDIDPGGRLGPGCDPPVTAPARPSNTASAFAKAGAGPGGGLHEHASASLAAIEMLTKAAAAVIIQASVLVAKRLIENLHSARGR